MQCRYLYTELSDASFGDRASAILGRFRDADPTSEAMQALAVQGQMMAQLSYIVDQLKARHTPMAVLLLSLLWLLLLLQWCQYACSSRLGWPEGLCL